jgi:hypothetical protein
MRNNALAKKKTRQEKTIDLLAPRELNRIHSVETGWRGTRMVNFNHIQTWIRLFTASPGSVSSEDRLE